MAISEIREGSDILRRHLAGGTWKRRKIEKKNKGKQTPGRLKDKLRCQLTPIGGQPRKFFMQSRSYRHPSYSEFETFCRKING